MTKTKQLGFGIKPPSKSCDDKNCPFHGTLKVRGKMFTGKVVSSKMQRSALVEWVGWRYIPKFERYKKKSTRISVHNPPCVNAVEGDMVKVGECRPISKAKSFTVLEVLGKVDKYQLEKEALEEGKYKEKAKSKENAVPEPKPAAEAPEGEE